MAQEFSQSLWHGIPRREIPWFPQVDSQAYIGCELCHVTRGRNVFDIEITDEYRRKAVVKRPYNCMVGCSTCAMICPSNAISFPPRDLITKAERERAIFQRVRAKAKEKRNRGPAVTARVRAETRADGVSKHLDELRNLVLRSGLVWVDAVPAA